MGTSSWWWQAGPKAVLSRTIASAASNFLDDVDPAKIETNLLHDDHATIVLHDVTLKRRVLALQLDLETSINNNDSNNDRKQQASVVVITGRAPKVTFSWNWSFSTNASSGGTTTTHASSDTDGNLGYTLPQDAWIQDAALTISGLDLIAQVEIWDCDSDEMKQCLADQDEQVKVADPSSKDAPPQTTITDNTWTAYLQQQMAMVMDSLQLELANATIRMRLPPTTQTISPTVGFEFVLTVKSLRNISHGRKRKDIEPVSTTTLLKGSLWQPTHPDPVSIATVASGSFDTDDAVQLDPQQQQPQPDGSTTPPSTIPWARENTLLQHVIQIEALELDLHQYTQIRNSHPPSRFLCPMLDTFSYSITLVRSSGERFWAELRTGLQVTGDEPGAKFQVFAGNLPMEALAQLGSVMKRKPVAVAVGGSSPNDKVEPTAFEPLHDDDDPTSFYIPFQSISIVRDDCVLFLPNVTMDYTMDGSVAKIQADGVYIIPNPDAPTAMQVAMYGFQASLQPYPKLELQAIDTIYIPGVMELMKPILVPTLEFPDNTLTIRLDAIHIQRLDPIDIPEGSEGFVNSSVFDKNSKETPKKPFSVPFPINFCLGEMHVKFPDKAVTTVRELEIDMAPGTHVTLVVQELTTELWTITNAAFFVTIPPDAVHELRDLKFAAELISVQAGYSMEDWIGRLGKDLLFLPELTAPQDTKIKKRSSKEEAPKIFYKLPFVDIEDLAIQVSIKGFLYSAKDVGFVIKQFKGNAKTTQKDLLSYYIGCILSRSPGFITNAEILGIDIWDSAAATSGFYMLATHMGPLGGIAALAGVDSVKGLINAGKRARKKSKDDDWRLGDIVRGTFQHAKESARKGAQMRSKDVYIGNIRVCKGKSEERTANVFDWATGATANFSKYARKNKGRLAGAVVGGVTMISATVMFGPLLGMGVGVLSQTVTEKVVDKVEKVIKTKKEKEEEWRKQTAERAKKMDQGG